LSTANETTKSDRFGPGEQDHSPVMLSANSAKRLDYDRALLSKPVQDAPESLPVRSTGWTDRSVIKASPENGAEPDVISTSQLLQAENDRLYEMAVRIQAHAIRPCGDSLKEFQPSDEPGQPANNGGKTGLVADPISCAERPPRGIHTESSPDATGDNRRRCERIRLSIPARTTGFDAKNGKWHEMAETVDVSRTGLRLRMRSPVLQGNVLYLTLPLPAKLRSHGYSEPHYSVYTLVRTVESAGNGNREVGLEFLGEHPPAGFIERPWAVFRKAWGGGERRRAPRVPRTEIVTVEYFSESMELIASEVARTENVGRSGLRIAVSAAPVEFDLVGVSCEPHGFDALAAVRNRFSAKDALERLCVQFIDREWPL
jgi:hypothetical protein